MTTRPNKTTANATGSGVPPQTPLPMAGAEHETTNIGEDMITREIPLRNLLGNTENVRKTGRRTAIQSLVTSIAEIGLLQNLVVMEVDPGDTRGGVPETPKDEALYRVIAGERRLTALRKLADANRMKWTEPVICTVRTGRGTTTATEVSLVENVIRQRLNPIDECDAFRKLIEENTSLAEIAHRFTVTERHIKQRLKLASLSDAVKQAGREGLITLGVLEAFTVSNDHAAQERVLKQGFEQGESEEWPGDEESETTRSDGPSWPAFLDPTWVKRELNQGLMLTTAPEMRAIGLDTYRARGGELSEDLFTALEEDIPQCVMNPELMQKLLQEKLQSVADEVAAETPGWKWVEIQTDANGHNTLGYGRVGRPASPPPEVTKKIAELEASGIGDPQFSPYENLGYEPEDWNRLKAYHDQHAALADEWRHKHTYTAAERAISGCIIVFRWNGIVIDRGLVKHKDYPAANAGVFAWADETTPPNGEVPLGAGTDTETAEPESGGPAPGADATAGGDAPAGEEDGAPGEEEETDRANPWREISKEEAVADEGTIVFHPAASRMSGQTAPGTDVQDGDDWNPGTTPVGYHDRTKAILKHHGLSGAAAERLRRRRMSTVRVHAHNNSKLMMDVFTYHHWTSNYATTIHPGTASDAMHRSEGARVLQLGTEMNADLRGTVSPDDDTAASRAVKAADQMDARLNLEWMNETDGAARFRALQALPPSMRQRLFVAAVSSLMRPQLAIDTNANLALEAAIDAMNIDWAGTCRPDGDYWLQTPTGWIRTNLAQTVNPKFATEKTKGKKAEIADRLEHLFAGKPNNPEITAENQDRINQWEIPGMRPRVSVDDPRMVTNEEVDNQKESTEPENAGEAAASATSAGTNAEPGTPPDDDAAPGAATPSAKLQHKANAETAPEDGGPETGPRTATAATASGATTGEDTDDAEDFDHEESTELPAFLQLND